MRENSVSAEANERKEETAACCNKASICTEECRIEIKDRELILYDTEWVVDGGSEPRRVKLSVSSDATIDTIIDKSTEALQYERRAILFADPDCEQKVLMDEKHWDLYITEFKSKTSERRACKVQELAQAASERALRSNPKQIEDFTLLALKNSDIATAALRDCVAAARAKIRAYGQLYELLAQKANMPGLERALHKIVHAVLHGLNPSLTDIADEVAGAAALVAWRMSESSQTMREALLQGGLLQKGCALIQHQLLRLNDLRLERSSALTLESARDNFCHALITLARSEHKCSQPCHRLKPLRDHLFRDLGADSLFCTRTSLSSCQNTVGMLDALSLHCNCFVEDFHRPLIIAGIHTLATAVASFLAIANDTEAFEIETRLVASAAAVRILTDSALARRTVTALYRNERLLEDICSTLLVDATPCIKLLSASTIAMLVRDPDARATLPKESLACAFSTLTSTVLKWGADWLEMNPILGQLRHPLEPHPDKAIECQQHKCARPSAAPSWCRVSTTPGEDETRIMVMAAMEHAALAVWGCAAALREHKHLGPLFEVPYAVWKLPPKLSTRVQGRSRSTSVDHKGNFMNVSRMSRGSFEIESTESTENESYTSIIKASTWPEILIRIAGLKERGLQNAQEAAACAIATTVDFNDGPQELLAAVPESPGILLDQLLTLVELSQRLGVRIHALAAIARVSVSNSPAVSAFYRGDFNGPWNVSADRRLAAVLMSASLPENDRSCNICAMSRELDDVFSAVLLNFAMHIDTTAQRHDDVLRAHVQLLTGGNTMKKEDTSVLRGVLHRGCLSIWALARNVGNRQRLNELGAPSALLGVLRGGADILTKETAVGALWLLSFDKGAGAIRVALAVAPEVSKPSNVSGQSLHAYPSKIEQSVATDDSSVGALSTLVGIIRFDAKCLGYIPIRTFAIGALYKLAITSDDLLNLIAGYASHFISEVYDLALGNLPRTSKRKHDVQEEALRAEKCFGAIQMLAVDLCFRLGNSTEGMAALTAAKGSKALEILSTTLIAKRNRKEMRAVGAFRTAKLACDTTRRKALDAVSAINTLFDNIRDNDVPLDVRLYTLHALLNLSTEFSLQIKICRAGLDVLIRFAQAAEHVAANLPLNEASLFQPTLPMTPCSLSSDTFDYLPQDLSQTDRRLDIESRYAQSILSNLSKNVHCRELMYQSQLAQLSAAVKRSRVSNRALDVQINDRPSSSEEGILDVIDCETLEQYFAQKPSVGSIPKEKVLLIETRPNEDELNRIRRQFFDPVTKLWEEEPLTKSHLESQIVDKSTLQVDSCTSGGQQRRNSFISASANFARGSSSSRTAREVARCNTASLSRAERWPRAPFRSSHRLGPIAGLPPAVLPQGECRWEPRIRSYTRLVDTDKSDNNNDITVRNSPRAVKLEPCTPYNSITFHAPLVKGKQRIKTTNLFSPANKMTSWPEQPATLAKFKHAKGAKLYSSLFPKFSLELESDEKHKDPVVEECFFYYTSSIVCEAIDPGPVPLPEAPLTLEAIVQVIPDLPILPVPTKTTPPSTLRPSTQCAPDIKYHGLQLSASTGHIGGIPRDPLPLYVRMVPKPVVEIDETDNVKAWDISESIFSSRASECDSKSFLETPKVWRKALDADWKRLLKEERFCKFVIREDEDVAKGGQNIEEEIREIKGCFARRYNSIIRIFDYYCACQTTTTKATWCLSENSYNRFLQECKVPDETTACTVDECGRIFITCNYESDKSSQNSEVNEDKALIRSEFLECFVRIAVARFRHETRDVSDCIDRLFDEVIFKNLPPECSVNADVFRRQRLYSRAVEEVLLFHSKPLQILYNKYSMLKPLQGRATFGLNEWLAIMSDTRLLAKIVSMRDARLAFWWARMVVIDEVKSRFRLMTLTWIEFLEAIGRLSDLTSLPADEDLETVHATNMLEFEAKVSEASPEVQDRIQERRASSVWNSDKTRPLADKVDKFCRLLLGRYGLQNKGAISFNGKRQALIGTYLTKQQLQETALL